MKVKIFVSAVSGLFLKLICHGAGTVVHLLLLKFSMYEVMGSEQCDQKKLPNVCKSCPKMFSLEINDFDTFTKIA